MKLYSIPKEILYTQDWHGWLIDNQVLATFNLNWNYILFSDLTDLLAFKLRFGV